MSNPNPEPGSLREAHLAGYRLDTSLPSCPGCTRSGSLSLLQRGHKSLVPGIPDTPDKWGCIKCPWEGWGIQEGLGIRVKVLDPETGHVTEPMSDIQQCWNEQEHMDVQRGGGGGAKGRRNPKPGDKLEKGRPEQEGALGGRDRASTVEKRSVVKTFRFTPAAAGLLDREAMLRRVPLQSIVDQALTEWVERHLCVELGQGA